MSDTMLIGLILGIAAVDSINPSVLLVTGYLLQQSPERAKARSVLAYIAGAYCFYFGIGLLLLIGFSAAADMFSGVFESRLAYIIQAIIGLGLFGWSWIPPKPRQQSRLQPTSFTPVALFGLGVVVTLVEFVTALPYLGAITLLQQAALPALSQVGTLIIYNLVVLLPPLGMLAIYSFNKERFAAWQAKREARRGGKPDDTLQWVAGVVGVLLILHALSGLGVVSIGIG